MKELIQTSPELICAICKDTTDPITTESIEAGEARQTKDGFVHNECYYQALGAGVEQNPICSPRVRHW